jgi:putative FmdB family regulatory protein
MPTYEYLCDACGHELELFQSITESPKKKCPACKKSKLRRKIGGGAGFLFKGSGFYLTDYRSDSYKKAAEAESKPASDAPKADGGAPKADAKKTTPASGDKKPATRGKKDK